MGEPADRVADYVARHHLTFPVLLDRDLTVSNQYGVRGTPTRYLIDRSGLLIAGGVGARDWASEAARMLIATLLEGAARAREG